MINPLSSSLAGMMSATKRMDDAASAIAGAGIPGSNANIDEELFKTLAAKQDYLSNATVLARARDMEKALGRIFDEKA